MKKRSLSLALCLVLALGLTAAAPAASAAWTDGPYTLTLEMPSTYEDDLTSEAAPGGGGESGETPADPRGVLVDLYLVAEAQDWAGYDAYIYEGPTTEFAGLDVPNGVEAMQAMDTDSWDALRWAAAEKVLGEGGLAFGEASAAASGLKLDEPVELAVAGLYLVVPHGTVEAADYVKAMAAETEGETHYGTLAWSADYEYTFEPQLVSVPGQRDAYGPDTAPEGDWDGAWVRELTVTLKPDRVDREGKLTIWKGIDEYDRDEPATFVFRVTAVKGVDGAGNPQTVYSNVFALTFDSASGARQKIDVEGIPVGSTVTVEEVYSGASYSVSGEGSRTVVVDAETDMEVEFMNTHEPERKQGHGVINEFTFDFDADSWQWHPVFPGTEEGHDTLGGEA